MSDVIITDSTALRELNVSGNDIGDNGISVITKGLQSNETLTKLNVSRCKLSVKGSYYIAIRVIIYKFNDLIYVRLACSKYKCHWNVKRD